MAWWIWLVAVALIFAARFMWRAYNHPSYVLLRQAANMNWVSAGTAVSDQGFRDTRLRRGNLLAEISFSHANVRLLQPAVQKTFRDFMELERWLGANNSERSGGSDKSNEVPAGSTRRVDYFAKVDSLLAAKGLREDFQALQGWDSDYGEATAKVCAVAELTNENPIVIAAFMAESVDYYHKNRDIALSYLSRLESGLRAKAENPELYAALDSEARSKEIAHELVAGIDLDDGSPEAEYINDVIEFMRSVNYYDELVLPAQEDEAFMAASANVYWAGYQAGTSPKVIGALVSDGANKFKSNPQFGILFLDKVAKNTRKQHENSLSASHGGQSIQNDNAIGKDHRHSDRQQNKEKFHLKKSADYHDLLDAVSGYSLEFIENHSLRGPAPNSEERNKLYAEILLFILVCKAKNDTAMSVHQMNWNTFKSGVEFRMLSIRDDGHPRSGVIRGADGSESLASFTSTYWGKLEKWETVLKQDGISELVRQFTREMGGDSGEEGDLLKFIDELSVCTANTILPKIASF